MSTQQDDRLATIYAEIETGVAKLTSSAEWLAMLDMAAKFPRYSMNNLILLYMQAPNATRVMGYGNKAGTTGWKSLGRHVKAGEKALKVLGPVKRWITETDKQTGQERRVQRVVAFKPLPVFSYEQTEGAPLPDVAPTELQGDAPARLWDGVVRQLDDLGWKTRVENPNGILGSAWGHSDPSVKTVRIKPGQEPLQALGVVLHEKGHVSLGHTDDLQEYARHRGRMEVETQSATYVVLRALGFDSAPFSEPYIAAWSGGDTEVVREVMGRVLTEARATLAPLQAIEQTFDAELVAEPAGVSL